MKSNTVVQIKVTLQGTKPPIWRRLLIPGSHKLGQLHLAIQAAMGWYDSHLHAFDINGQTFGRKGSVDDVADENRLTIDELLQAGIKRFTYTYDFGDDWEHTVALEKLVPAVEGQAYPICVTAKRNCPPEDCGGVWGYEELLTALADPNHPEHDEQMEWVGEGFDPEVFDLDRANTLMASSFANVKQAKRKKDSLS